MFFFRYLDLIRSFYGPSTRFLLTFGSCPAQGTKTDSAIKVHNRKLDKTRAQQCLTLALRDKLDSL